MPRHIVLIAHGSRLDAANQEVVQLARDLEQRLRIPVTPAFLELCQPDIPEAIDLAAQNADEVDIFPYFLTQGRHVSRDLPSLIAGKITEYPEVRIRMLDYLGAHPELADLIAALLLRI